jgi:hypothetical protein
MERDKSLNQSGHHGQAKQESHGNQGGALKDDNRQSKEQFKDSFKADRHRISRFLPQLPLTFFVQNVSCSLWFLLIIYVFESVYKYIKDFESASKPVVW